MVGVSEGIIQFSLNSKVRQWLETGASGDIRLEGWLEGKGDKAGILEVGSILVDEKVLKKRFDCVPERCSPVRGRRKWRCCCEDFHVPLSAGEKDRLARWSNELRLYLARCEPRLECGKGSFYLDEEGGALCRPGGRCVFSQLDRRGRIRCHLRKFAERHGISRSDVQPYTCRMFPLLLILVDSGRILLTVLDKSNYKAFNTYAPKSFPCLADPSLPPLVESMAGTLDWLFGEGFARELSRLRL